MLLNLRLVAGPGPGVPVLGYDHPCDVDCLDDISDALMILVTPKKWEVGMFIVWIIVWLGDPNFFLILGHNKVANKKNGFLVCLESFCGLGGIAWTIQFPCHSQLKLRLSG